MTIQAVVLDIGNVLVEWDPAKLFDAEIGAQRRKMLFEQVDLDNMNLDVDRGAPFHETLTKMADTHPDWRKEIEMWRDRWIDMCRPEIPRSVRLQRALRAKGIPVFALSNFGVQTFDLACTVYPFLKEFDQSYISGHMNTIKPEAAIYQQLEAGCGLAPETLLFTDDRADNIAAAAARGWQTHLFEGPQGWAERLVAEGLLLESEAA